jgi:hypothetical protein
VADPATAPMFRTLLGDSMDVGTSLAAIHALERMKDSGSLPLLATLIQKGTTPDSIRGEAQKAYNTISGSEIYRK